VTSTLILRYSHPCKFMFFGGKIWISVRKTFPHEFLKSQRWLWWISDTRAELSSIVGHSIVPTFILVLYRDEKQNLRFPCIQWERNEKFFFVPTVYKGNANFVFRPWYFNRELSVIHIFCREYRKSSWKPLKAFFQNTKKCGKFQLEIFKIFNLFKQENHSKSSKIECLYKVWKHLMLLLKEQ
jgi:hypothetical protein